MQLYFPQINLIYERVNFSAPADIYGDHFVLGARCWISKRKSIMTGRRIYHYHLIPPINLLSYQLLQLTTNTRTKRDIINALLCVKAPWPSDFVAQRGGLTTRKKSSWDFILIILQWRHMSIKTSQTTVNSTVCSTAFQGYWERKSSTSLTLCRWIPHTKGPIMWKAFLWNNAIMSRKS